MLDGAALLRLYEGMLRVEAFERTLDDRYRKGLCPGGVHLYLGEEAVATGVCSALYARGPRSSPACSAHVPSATVAQPLRQPSHARLTVRNGPWRAGVLGT